MLGGNKEGKVLFRKSGSKSEKRRKEIQARDRSGRHKKWGDRDEQRLGRM